MRHSSLRFRRGPDVEIFLGVSMSAEGERIRKRQGSVNAGPHTIFFLLDSRLGLFCVILDGFTIDLDLIIFLLGLVIRLDDFSLGRQFCGKSLQTSGMVDGVEGVGSLLGSGGDLLLVS